MGHQRRNSLLCSAEILTLIMFTFFHAVSFEVSAHRRVY